MQTERNVAHRDRMLARDLANDARVERVIDIFDGAAFLAAEMRVGGSGSLIVSALRARH